MNSGKQVTALSSIGSHKDAKDDAFWAFSACNLLGMKWWAGLNGSGAEVLYTVQLGKGLKPFEEANMVASKTFENGLIVLNDGTEDKNFEFELPKEIKKKYLVDLYDNSNKIQIKKKNYHKDDILKIYRLANQKDIETWQQVREKEEPIKVEARKIAGNLKLQMKISDVEFQGDGAKVTALHYTDRNTEESHEVALDGVFVQIGLVPNNEWLGDVVKRSKHGEIEIDERGQTSIPGVFAAGDATTVPYKQIVIAAGQGATAALSAFDYLIRSEG